MLHGLFAVHGTSSSGYDSLIAFEPYVDLIFNAPKAFRAMLLDQVLQQPSVMLLNHQVRIDKAISKALGENHSHRALPGARHTY